MAGAGYKLFNTGDVLTAAQVNTYLMEQTVMVFADAAARTAALSGVVSEGMISYLKDTNAVEVYDGSNWVASDDPNAIQNSIINAKGDLIVGSANDTPSILSVSSDGSTLVADSSATTGLRWQGNFAAGKNLITNGNMNLAQRGTSLASLSTGETYLVDRFPLRNNNLGTATYSQETDAPAGFKTSAKILFTTADATPAAGDFSYFRQKFEGQALQSLKKGTASAVATTLSFWVKSNVTGTYIVQLVDIDNSRIIAASYSISASNTWEKKTLTFAGDTTGALDNDSNASFMIGFALGAGSDRTSGTLNTSWASLVTANEQVGQVNVAAAVNNYWMITGVQWEIGNVATDFQLSAGTLAGELAACQRYYSKSYAQATAPASTVSDNSEARMSVNRTDQYAVDNTFVYPVVMRATPTITLYSPSTGTAARVRDAGAAADRAATAVSIGDRTAYITLNSGVTTTANATHLWHWIASAEL